MAAKTLKKVTPSKKNKTKAPSSKKVRENLSRKNTAAKIAPAEPQHDWSQEFAGLALVALALVVCLSLISQYAGGGASNLLGPYLGVELADFLNRMTGQLPALLLVLAVSALGVKLIHHRGENTSFKFPLVVALLYLWTMVLLSIKNLGMQNLSTRDFETTGGFLGNFLVQQALVPVFGQSTFGPYLSVGLLIFFTVVWGFKLRTAQVVEKGVELLGIFYFPVLDAWNSLKLRKAKRNARFREKLLESLGLEWDGEVVSAAFSNEAAGKAPKQAGAGAQPAKPKKRKGKKAAEPEASLENVEAMAGEENLDPIEIRRRRDFERELRRIAELNQWELQKKDPTLGGLLSKKGGPSDSAQDETDDDEVMQLENVLKKKKEGPPKSRDKSEETTEEAGEESAREALESGFEEEVMEGESAESTEENTAEPEVEPEPEVEYDEYVVPEIDAILEEPPPQTIEYTEEFLKEQARALEEQLANFKVLGKVVGICSGPVIIRYEVELAPGVKVNQVSNLSDDLAMALKAKSIRILAPIPGKSAVGIEVPNKKAQIVYIKNLLKSKVFRREEDTLKLVLGKDIGGEPCVMDLTKAPHLLIAGQTGSGKSVCINSFMASLLSSKTPDEVRLILVDPKVVELKPYDSIPHLLAPVVTQPEVAVQALKWATVEMDNRYNMLAKAGVRNIKGFNHKARAGQLKDRLKEEQQKPMPFIIIVIDELADLMMVAGKEVETSIARVAQKARAVGIHLILATQRPSTNVITGTIKANLPTRVAFQVASQIDARTIMDKAGCEKLLGRGDMLFRSIDSPEPERIHGAFLDDEQAESIAKACSEQFVNYPHISSFEVEENSADAEEEDIPRDAKFRDAAELVVSLRQASVSLLQRRMSIGYARSGRIVDQLERAGIVGRDRGSKPREVLMDELELQSFLSSGLND